MPTPLLQSWTGSHVGPCITCFGEGGAGWFLSCLQGFCRLAEMQPVEWALLESQEAGGSGHCSTIKAYPAASLCKPAGGIAAGRSILSCGGKSRRPLCPTWRLACCPGLSLLAGSGVLKACARLEVPVQHQKQGPGLRLLSCTWCHPCWHTAQGQAVSGCQHVGCSGFRVLGASGLGLGVKGFEGCRVPYTPSLNPPLRRLPA